MNATFDNIETAVAAAREQAKELQREVRVLRDQDVNKRLKLLESENKALKEVVTRLKGLRRRDRTRIAEWKRFIAETYSRVMGPDEDGDMDLADDRPLVGLAADASGSPTANSTTVVGDLSQDSKFDPPHLKVPLADAVVDAVPAAKPWMTTPTKRYNGDENTIPSCETAPTDSPRESQNILHPSIEQQFLPASSPPADRAGRNPSLPLLQYSISAEQSSQTAPILETLLLQGWHPKDFIPNPRFETPGGPGAQQQQQQLKRGAPLRSKLERALDIVGLPRTLIDEYQENTPPGFWRSRMATTQENAAEREEMLRLRSFDARYRLAEALLGNDGQFVFRDDKLRQLVTTINI